MPSHPASGTAQNTQHCTRANGSGAVKILVHVHGKGDMCAALGDHSAQNLMMQHADTGLIFGGTQENVCN